MQVAPEPLTISPDSGFLLQVLDWYVHACSPRLPRFAGYKLHKFHDMIKFTRRNYRCILGDPSTPIQVGLRPNSPALLRDRFGLVLQIDFHLFPLQMFTKRILKK